MPGSNKPFCHAMGTPVAATLGQQGCLQRGGWVSLRAETQPLAGHMVQNHSQPQLRGCSGLQHPHGTFGARWARPPLDVTACPRAPLAAALRSPLPAAAEPPHPCSSHGQVRTLARPSARWQPAPAGSLSAIKPEWVFPPSPPSSSSSFWGYCF